MPRCVAALVAKGSKIKVISAIWTQHHDKLARLVCCILPGNNLAKVPQFSVSGRLAVQHES